MLNREACFDATRRLMEVERGPDGVMAVMMLRIRRFREFNIRFGYASGDALIAVLAEHLLHALRPVDELIQVGACDFAILLPALNSPEHAALAAAKIMRLFQDPITVEGRVMPIDAALGVAVYPEHGDEPDRLFRCAERAYGVARASIDRYALFEPVPGEADVGHDELHEAIVNNRLDLFLQPIWDLRENSVAGVECLARWHSPRWGWVDPQAFITLAEQTGLIMPLTRWSMNIGLHHCAQARLAGLELPFAINLSPRVFAERGIAEQLIGSLRLFDIPPELVILEVTETTVMDDPALSARLLGQLRDAGLRIAIDDFGIGHSTFAYLQHIPATELKIDKSFVIDMMHSARTPRLVQSMIELADSLELDVVAEGVEDEDTLRLLGEMGCRYAQGYHIGRPQPAAAFLDAVALKKRLG
jgi:diguanylate cyclase (GGDEF)-like protein